jgi:adenylyltransferase/sulfurtransferase
MGFLLVLSNDELERYNRQMIIEGWNITGQDRLKAAKVVILGIGGLGCPVSLYLAAAGIGTLELVDEGNFELSNLNRQILGWVKDVGRRKVESVAEKLQALNPNVKVKTVYQRITEENISDLISDSDIVIDCLDNWGTRFILNHECVKQRKPLIHAGIRGLYGQAMTILPGKGPCLRCLIVERPPEVHTFPVLGATAGLLANIQVIEAIKVLLDLGRFLVGKLLFFDGLNTSFTIIDVNRSPTCPVCREL